MSTTSTWPRSVRWRIALDAGMPPEMVSFAGPGKTSAELSCAVAAGVLVELESAGEARRIAAAGEDLGLRPRVAVRVNPDFAVKGSGMRMGGGPQQFGVDVEQTPAMLELVADLDLRLEGFHVFAGSQNLQADVLVEAQRRTAELVLALADKCADPPTYVNLGGGFGIPYSDRDEPLDVDRVGEQPADAGRRRDAEGAADPRGWSSSSVASSSARPASTSRAWSIARCRAGRRTSSSTAACTTSSRRRGTSAR